MRIDLKELAERESEQVEWKENVADTEDVVRAVVAFANDYSNLGGGYVVCGAAETRDEHGFQKMALTGMTAARCREVEGAVLSDCREKVEPPIVPIVDEQSAATPDRRILVFIVPASGHAHCFRGRGRDASKYFIRIGRETREARNSLLRELLVRKKALEPWDRRVCREAGIADIDLVVFRDMLQEMGLWDSKKPLDDYFSSESKLSEFVPPLIGREPLTGQTYPRYFTLLLFGKEPTRYIPGAYAIYSKYHSVDRGQPAGEQKWIKGTIQAQARMLMQLLSAEALTLFDKSDPRPNQAAYPERALQEAVVNALAHRDYESDHPARVTVFMDRIEILSPGSLPREIKPEDFKTGKSFPVWRNQSLAYFLNKMRLAQAEGQGIPTILRLMDYEGCPPPIFDLRPGAVLCTLPANPRKLKNGMS
ncbi:MAG: putative DNA binding domain-containing protein [Candidatus Sumerlaeota bacterium]|nr:putative DNA binding domain-containing protein [Candidatus Sumerlaeota bacterium]